MTTFHDHCRRRRVLAVYFLVTTISALAIGCGGPDRWPIEGNVTLDGKPLVKGQINFTPVPGTSGPTAGSPVIDGRYSVESDKGLMVGKFQVEIRAFRQTPTKIRTLNTATGQMELVEKFESMIPARYNTNTELTANVTAEGPNEFNFDLKSK